MLNKIKYIYYKYLYSKVLGLDTLENKIKYILIHDIKLYTEYAYNTDIDVITNDIVELNNDIKDILNSNYLTEYLNTRDIHTNNIKNITLSKFFTNNGYIIDEEVLIDFLNNSIILDNVYRTIAKNHNNYIAHGNSIKLQPYIINIRSIVNTLLKQYQ